MYTPGKDDENPVFKPLHPMFVTLNGIEAEFIENQLQGLRLMLKAILKAGYEFDPVDGPANLEQTERMLEFTEQAIHLMHHKDRGSLN